MNSPWLLNLYEPLLQLYPEDFRARYAPQMLDAVRLMLSERENTFQLTANLVWDALRGACVEHLSAFEPVTPGTLAAFAVAFLLALLVISVGSQQAIRIQADKIPGRVAASVGQRLAAGQDPASFLATPVHDLASSDWLGGSSSFVAVYDAEGQPIASDATLHGDFPQPPSGLFDHLSRTGLHKVTWQPQRGVRIALVGVRIADGRFVFSGQSLQRSEDHVRRIKLIMLSMTALMFAACLFIHRITNIGRLTR